MNSTMAFTLAVSLFFSQQKTNDRKADDKVFSGPQVGQKFPTLEVIEFGDEDGKKVDFIEQADGKPVVVIFIHKMTRPAAGTIRAITNYCAKRHKDGLRNCVIYLTDDPTAAGKRMQRSKRIFIPSEKTIFGISHQGIEGPGSYGLNRNVTLTVLVGKGNKVTANFALKQPAMQVDVPKITGEIVKLVGGKVPTLAELGVRRKQKKNTAGKRDTKIEFYIRPLISKDAGPRRVNKAAKELEDYAAKHPQFKAEIGDFARKIQKSGALKRYGTETARNFLKKWANEWKSEARKQKKRKRKADRISDN